MFLERHQNFVIGICDIAGGAFNTLVLCLVLLAKGVDIDKWPDKTYSGRVATKWHTCYEDMLVLCFKYVQVHSGITLLHVRLA